MNLSPAALAVLEELRRGPIPRDAIEPMMRKKLSRLGLVGSFSRPIPGGNGEPVQWMTAEVWPTDPTRPPDSQRSAFVPIGSKVGRSSLLIIDDDEGDEAPDPDQARPDRAGGPEGGRGG